MLYMSMIYAVRHGEHRIFNEQARITKFLNFENHRTAYIEYIAPNSKIAVIIVHGLADHKGRYKDFINQLSSADISVYYVHAKRYIKKSR